MTSAGVVVVVGGGILGTTHALWALDNDFDVVHLESDLAARSASVRNFGLVWVGGRAGGPELELALRARELWEVVANKVPEIGFRPAGSLTVATDERELALMEAAFEREDSAERQWELLEAVRGPGSEPRAFGGRVGGALLRRRRHRRTSGGHPGHPGVHGAKCAATAGCPGRSAVELADGAVRDNTGAWHRGDWVFVCTGARRTGLVEQYVERPPTRRVRLQMLETAPYPGRVDDGAG